MTFSLRVKTLEKTLVKTGFKRNGFSKGKPKFFGKTGFPKSFFSEKGPPIGKKTPLEKTPFGKFFSGKLKRKLSETFGGNFREKGPFLKGPFFKKLGGPLLKKRVSGGKLLKKGGPPKFF